MRFMPHFELSCGFEKTPRAFALLPGLALLFAALLALPAQAQWAWRDKAGQVNASDRPPPRDVPDKDIISRPLPDQRRLLPAPAQAASGNVVGAASAPASALERELQARKRAAEQEQAARAKAEEERSAAQRAENCRSARSQIAALESGQRIARMNEQGEREILDDKGRAEEQRRAREAVAANCK